MAEGSPAPIVASALSSKKRVGDVGAVVAREPDLVHAVVEADDAVLRHDLAHVADDALRRDREAVLVGAVVDARQDLLPQREEVRIRIELAAEPVGEQREARADVADHLGMREEDLLDIGRGEADMDHLRSARCP